MSKKAIKVSHNGETKRFKITQSYESLALQTREMFGNDLAKMWPIKFYYVDDEQELISISSQSDFQEALIIDELPILKLTVANNVQDARIQLEALHSQSMSLTESLNQSQIMNNSMRMSTQFGNMPVIPRISEMNPFPSAVLETERNEYKKISHEMGVGGGMVNSITQSVSTDVKELVGRGEIGVNTKVAVTTDANINTSLQTAQVSIQAEAQTKDMGCDGSPAVKTMHNGNQMEELKQASQEIECNILMPSDEDGEEECIEEHIDCFKCKGTQVNSKGLPCRKCNGSGQFNLKGYGSVVQSVREEIEAYCTEQFRALYSDYAQKNKVFQKDQIHTDYSCNECGCDPIKGIRYLCTQCEDYDLCSKCEAKGVHSEHVMLKIRKVHQGEAKFMCQYPSHSGSKPELAAEVVEQKQESINTFVNNQVNKKEKKGTIRYQARFVKESLEDKYKVKPNEDFTKTWTYRNGGETAWPKDVMFIQTSGDDMGSVPIPITTVVEADQSYTVEVKFRAPERVGKYTSYFRLQTGHNIRFGHKVWCDIQVEEPQEEVKQVEVIEVKPEVPAIKEELVNIEKPIEMPQVPSDQNPAESDMSVSQQLKASKTPKQIYFDQVVQIEDVQVSLNLTQLFEFGYVDFKTNLELLTKYCNHLEAVMNHLLDNPN